MTKEKFIELTGDTPQNLIGDNWQEVDLVEWLDEGEYTHEGHEIGGCFICQDGL